MIDFLREGRPGTALLDVFDQEPLSPESELWTLPDVSITPLHVDGGSSEQALIELFLTNFDWVLGGRAPLGLVWT